MSASASGPIGWLQPSFIPLSISSAVARPSCSAKIASLIIGQRIRLTTKPGAVLHDDRRLAQALGDSASAAATVASVGLQPADQLDQRHHRHRVEEVHADERSPGRDVAAASLVIEIDDVFDGDDRAGPRSASTCFRILTLSSSFSVAASMHEVAAAAARRSWSCRGCASAPHPCPRP